jgi:hypothetical protein
MEIIITIEELEGLLAKALNADVTHIAFIPDDRVIIGTNLNISDLNRSNDPVIPLIRNYVQPPIVPPAITPEPSPEDMARVLNESQKLEGLVYEHTRDGEIITRRRNESEANLPPGEPVIYVRSKEDE